MTSINNLCVDHGGDSFVCDVCSKNAKKLAFEEYLRRKPPLAHFLDRPYSERFQRTRYTLPDGTMVIMSPYSRRNGIDPPGWDQGWTSSNFIFTRRRL
jgi:hypothetical protein